MSNKISGIYKIENKINGKVYVGQSVNIKLRWEKHKSDLINKTHVNIYLQHSFDKYGIDNFSFKIIELCDKSQLSNREIYWIDKLNSFKNGYNLTTGGEGRPDYEVSDETREKLRVSRIGFKLSEESKAKISKSQTGRKLPDEWKKNISNGHIKNINNGKIIPNTINLKNHIDKTKEKIKCYNKNGEIVGIYDSIQEAGRILNIQATNICKNLKGKYRTCNGVVFVYFNEELTKEEINKRFKRSFIKNSTKII